MPLTPEQQQHVAQHLNTRSKTPKCPVCAASNLRVQPELFRRTALQTEASQLAVVVECGYCGHLMHFSPAVIGLDAAELS